MRISRRHTCSSGRDNNNKTAKQRMFLVGLTGGIATGKSTVSDIFRELGCVVLDADLFAKEVVKPGTRAWEKIKDAFGVEVIMPNGDLNREKLGQIIFSDNRKRKLLNSITHPEIYKCMAVAVLKSFLSGNQFVILDLPLLFETGQMLPYISYSIVVSCSEDQQMERLMKRNQYDGAEARSRVNAQMSLEEKLARASYVINNSGTEEETRCQVEKLHGLLRSSWAQWKIRVIILAVTGVFTFTTRWIFRQLVFGHA